MREIVYGVYGAWRLARLDRGGLGYFDDSVRGFWNSFFAAALVVPGYAILVLLDPVTPSTSSGALRIFLIHVLTYCLSWTVYPVIVHPLCQAMDKEAAYIRFIVAFNWAKVIQMAAYLPVAGILATNVLPGGAADVLHGIVYMLLLGYQWFVTRTALDIRGWPASGLVALDFMTGVILSVLAVGMLR